MALPAGTDIARELRERVPRVAFSLEEARAATGIGRNTLLKAIREGKLRVKRLGKRVIIPASALEEFLNS